MEPFRANFEKMEKELNDHRTPIPTAVMPAVRQPAPLPQLPDYVQPSEGVSDLGRITAGAVVADYEAAAKQIESLGEELKELAKTQEVMLEELKAGIEDVNTTAKRFREDGARIFKEIERCALLTANVRKTCSDMREKMILPPEKPNGG